MATTRRIMTKKIVVFLFLIVVLVFASPSLVKADAPSVQEIEREIEKDLKKYFKENPEDAEAFFNKNKYSFPAGAIYYGPDHCVVPYYGPVHRIIPYIYKYGDRGWDAAIKVYKKLIDTRDSVVSKGHRP